MRRREAYLEKKSGNPMEKGGRGCLVWPRKSQTSRPLGSTITPPWTRIQHRGFGDALQKESVEECSKDESVDHTAVEDEATGRGADLGSGRADGEERREILGSPRGPKFNQDQKRKKIGYIYYTVNIFQLKHASSYDLSVDLPE